MSTYKERILLDRYAIKDATRELLPGDMVVVSRTQIFEQEERPVESREIAHVVRRDGNYYDVRLDDETKEVLEAVPRDRLEYCVEQTYRDICERVARATANGDTDFEASVFDLMMEEKFIPAGRPLAGLGRDDYDLTLFNCYVFALDGDSRASISRHWARLFETYSRGGGIGWNLSILRPKGAVVRKVNGRSSGSVSWAEQFSQITGAVEQGGSRRGAGLQGLEVWHPDIEEFIRIKARRETFKAPDGQVVSRNENLLKNSNISVLITGGFMDAVEQDADWDLVFPDLDDPEYDALWDGDLERWRGELGKEIVTYRTVKARELWNSITQRAWESGEPGIIFLDRCNEMSNSYYYNRITCTNPCVTGDTPIFTSAGVLTVTELLDTGDDFFTAPQDERTRTSDCRAKQFFATGVKPIYRVQTVEGYYVRCTGDHQLQTPEGWVRVNQLNQDDQILLHQGGGGFGTEGSLELGQLIGWFAADGHWNNEKAVLSFYEEKQELADRFAEMAYDLAKNYTDRQRDYTITPCNVTGCNKKTVEAVRLARLFREHGVVPETFRLGVPRVVRAGTKEMQAAYLQALFTADGTVRVDFIKGSSVRLDSIHPELLEGVQQLLLNFGIVSTIYWDRRTAGNRPLPDGKGGCKNYYCQAQHTLHIAKANILRYEDEIGFLLKRKQAELEKFRVGLRRKPNKEKFVATIESITLDGKEVVYDTQVDETHAYTTGGLISHNCGEENLPPNAVCNLSHINLAKFTTPSCTLPEQERTATDAAKLLDWDALTAAIHTGIRFLDTVIDLNRYHEDAIEKQQTSERRIGLGFLGYGELLIRLGLRYGSDEAIKFTTRLMKHFSSQSYLASVELAKELGAFPAFEFEPFLKSGFMKRHAKQVKDAVQEHGIRNVTVNTVAPTGSVASLLQTSGGCEPFFDLEYTATTRIGVVREQMPILADLVDKFGSDRDKWPDYVVTAQRGITPVEHVRTQGAIQRWIDASLSKTANLPGTATVQDVADAYLEMWRCGCKGGTAYRDGSRDEQVLYADAEATVEVVEESADTEVIPRRPDVGHSITFSEESPVGTVHATLRHDSSTGDVRDIFLAVSKGDVSADAEAIGRLCSMILGWPNNKHVNQQTRLELIRNQLIDILGRGQVGFGPMAKRSLPDTVAKIINRYLEADFPAANLPVGRNQMESLLDEVRELAGDAEAFDKLKRYVLDGDINGNGTESEEVSPEKEIQQAESNGVKLPYDICPYCGNVTLVRIPGKCSYCRECGESLC